MLLALQELPGMVRFVLLMSALLLNVLLDTFTIAIFVSVNLRLLHAVTMLSSTELLVFVSTDTTSSTEFVKCVLMEPSLMDLSVLLWLSHRLLYVEPTRLRLMEYVYATVAFIWWVINV